MTWIWEWPRISITTRIGTISASMNEAQACLKSWNLCLGNPDDLSKAWNRRVTAPPYKGSPDSVVNTSSQ